MTKLYELTQNYQNLVSLLEDETIDSSVVGDAIRQIEGDIIDKAQNIAKLLKNMEGDIKVFEAEEKRLRAKRTALEKKCKSLKVYLETELRKIGVKKIDGIVPLSFRLCPPSVEIVDITQIPERFLIQTAPEVDKKAILEAWRNGETLPNSIQIINDKEYLKVG